MKFSVDVFDSNEGDLFSSNEKPRIGCSIFIQSESLNLVSQLLNIEKKVNNKFAKVISTTLQGNKIVIDCEFDELETVESIWDMVNEWKSLSELFTRLLIEKGICCEWELKLHVGLN